MQAARITAMAAWTAYGAGLDVLAEGIRAGHCPVRRATGIGYPEDPPPLVSACPARPLPPGEAATATLLRDTVDQLVANWPGDVSALHDEDTALIVGCGGFLYASSAELFWRAQYPDAATAPFYVRGPSWGSDVIAAHLGLRGTVLTLSTGCSSSANAVLVAAEMVQRGRAQRAIVVGAEGLSAETLSGFASLMLLPPDGCRPFDRDRAGLQIGEGIAALMLERDVDVTRDECGITVLGGANLCDPHHLTGANPDGRVMREVMQQALASAGVSAADIVAIKAHGTGSVDNDQAEARALGDVFYGFGKSGDSMPPVVGLKRYLGHTLGACGAIEVNALSICFKRNFLPATAGFEMADPELQVIPTQAPLAARPGAYLLNFFGLGGNYTSLILEMR